MKALCTSTDWIDKPTDIPSKITELQDFLLLYLDFDFFYAWNRRKRILNMQGVNMICILKNKWFKII